MEDIPFTLQSIFRWFHVIAGITWIGLLYFFNWVNIPFQAAIEGDAKKKVNPELLPRALFWFRWGAFWTWVTGVLLLLLVFYHTGDLFADSPTWGLGAIIMVLATFLAVFVYDAVMKMEAMKKTLNAGIFGWIAVAIMVYLFAGVGGFGYRGYAIHVGAMFGTMMAFNVWFRIWPAQKKIIGAIKAGETPPADQAALAGQRSRHNTYMSIPLIWTMINAHTVFGPFPNEIALLVMVAAGWWLGSMFYRMSLKPSCASID